MRVITPACSPAEPRPARRPACWRRRSRCRGLIYPPVAVDIALLGAVRGRGRPAARLHRAAVLRPRRVLGHLGVRHRAGRRPQRRCRSRSRCSAARLAAAVLARADRLPGGAAHRHLLRDGHAGVRADGLLRRQPVARPHRRRERPAGRAPRRSSALDLSDPFFFYYAGLPIVLLGLLAAWRDRALAVRPGAGRASGTTRPAPARSATRSHRYKLLAFVLSAGLAGLGRRAVRDRPRLRLAGRACTGPPPGKAVMMVVLGGIGTLWGGVARRRPDRRAGGLPGHGRVRGDRHRHRYHLRAHRAACSAAASGAPYGRQRGGCQGGGTAGPRRTDRRTRRRTGSPSGREQRGGVLEREDVGATVATVAAGCAHGGFEDARTRPAADRRGAHAKDVRDLVRRE